MDRNQALIIANGMTEGMKSPGRQHLESYRPDLAGNVNDAAP